jgi:pilus assembly protein CpaC
MTLAWRRLLAGGLCWLAAAAAHAVEPMPDALTMAPGDLHSVSVDNLTRVAIGNDEVADVEVISTQEVLVQAKADGETQLVLWDTAGRHEIQLSVVSPGPEAVGQQLRRIFDQLNLGQVQVRVDGAKMYLTGELPGEADRDRVEQVLTMFPGITNLTTVSIPPAPPPPGTPDLVRLNVQVLEISRSDVERLGVDWSETLGITQPARSDSTLRELLFKWGTGLSRSSVTATLNALITNNRARLLAEPKLVTTSGKPAESFLGGEVPILSSSSTGIGSGVVTTEVEFKEFGVRLGMTPTVAADRRTITTALNAEVSSIDTSTAITVSGVSVPGFKVRSAQTELVTSPEETIVVAGLLQAEDSQVVDKVPGVGSIPVVGRLFRSPDFQTRQTELVIAVTPELMADADQDQDRLMALEQALAVSEVASAVEDPKLRYALQVQERIARAIRYPQRERELGMEGRVNVRLHLFADGTLGRAIVAQSSGLEALDAEALKAAETQAPYPAFPTQLKEQDVWLDIPVLFRP